MVEEVFHLIKGGFVMGEDLFDDNLDVHGALALRFSRQVASIQRGFDEEKLSLSLTLLWTQVFWMGSKYFLKICFGS